MQYYTVYTVRTLASCVICTSYHNALIVAYKYIGRLSKHLSDCGFKVCKTDSVHGCSRFRQPHYQKCVKQIACMAVVGFNSHAIKIFCRVIVTLVVRMKQ